MEEIPRNIIEKAAHGDIQAFEAIYRATSGFVYRVTLGIVNNSADAQETVQDIFMKIYANLKHFEFRSSFKTWVYRLTVNAAINAYNKNMRRMSRRGDFDTAVETAGYAPEISQSAQKADTQRLLQSLLERLTPEHRAVVALREMEGLSYEAIAQSLKINLNTVRTRLKRAREALMKLSQKAVQDEM